MFVLSSEILQASNRKKLYLLHLAKKALKGEIFKAKFLSCYSYSISEICSCLAWLSHTQRSVDQLTNVSMSISSDSNSPTYSGRPSCVRASPRAGYESSSLSSDWSSDSVVSLMSAAGPSVFKVSLKTAKWNKQFHVISQVKDGGRRHEEFLWLQLLHACCNWLQSRSIVTMDKGLGKCLRYRGDLMWTKDCYNEFVGKRPKP